MIQGLIDKQDNFEIVRDKIGSILVNEVASQKGLAVNDGKDPALWDLAIYLERSSAFENYLNSETDVVPIVNIWADNINFDGSASNISERQKATCIYNIDCYGFGKSSDVVAGGYLAGDEQANYTVQRAVRLVRNILFASNYTYLDLRGLVWQRWLQSIVFYQPEINANAIQKVSAARLSFQVMFNELSPQFEGENLEIVSVDIKRELDGQLIAEADYDYTI